MHNLLLISEWSTRQQISDVHFASYTADKSAIEWSDFISRRCTTLVIFIIASRVISFGALIEDCIFDGRELCARSEIFNKLEQKREKAIVRVVDSVKLPRIIEN